MVTGHGDDVQAVRARLCVNQLRVTAHEYLWRRGFEANDWDVSGDVWDEALKYLAANG